MTIHHQGHALYTTIALVTSPSLSFLPAFLPFLTYNPSVPPASKMQWQLAPPCNHGGGGGATLVPQVSGQPTHVPEVEDRRGASTLPEVFCSWCQWWCQSASPGQQTSLGQHCYSCPKGRCGECQGSPADGGAGGLAEDLVGKGPKQRMTEALLGSHAGQQGRCGLGVSERQEARESPVSGLAGRNINQLTCNRPRRS